MSTKNDTKARMQGNKPAPAKQAAVAPVHKVVRTTLDIDPNLWRQLMSWCADIAVLVGKVKVHQVWVLREVIREALEDEAFQAKVIVRLRKTLEEMDKAKGQ